MFGKNKWNKKSFVLKKVKEDGQNLQYASDELKDDKDVVLAAIQNNGEAIQYASVKFKNDETFARIAIVNSNGVAVDYISPELQQDCSFMIGVAKLICDEVSLSSCIYVTSRVIQIIQNNNLTPTITQAKDLLEIAKAYHTFVEKHDQKTSQARENLQAIYNSMGFYIPQSQIIERAQLAEEQAKFLMKLGTEADIMHRNLATLSKAKDIYDRVRDKENQAV